MKVWSKESIRDLIETNDKMVVKSVLKLYEYQTASEQSSGVAKESNGKGFNYSDAPFLSGVAQVLLNGKGLSQRQLDLARTSLLKYAGQLAKIANSHEEDTK